MLIDERNFFDSVYALVRQVPEGRVTTYGAIAFALGTPRSARMVGWALNKCRGQIPPVPAHRVVNRCGVLTGRSHFEALELMAGLLRDEGVVVEEDRVRDFQTLFWDPAQYNNSYSL